MGTPRGLLRGPRRAKVGTGQQGGALGPPDGPVRTDLTYGPEARTEADTDRPGTKPVCSHCRLRPPTEGGLCLPCIMALAVEAEHAYDVERTKHNPLASAIRALARLGQWPGPTKYGG